LQYLKHPDPRISTEHGIKIDLSVENENANESICFNDDGDSNEIESNEDGSDVALGNNCSDELGTQIHTSETTPQTICRTLRTPSITTTRRRAPAEPPDVIIIPSSSTTDSSESSSSNHSSS
jgi:hypothetical protein